MNPPPPLNTPEDLHGPPAVESPRQVPGRLFSWETRSPTTRKINNDSHSIRRSATVPTVSRTPPSEQSTRHTNEHQVAPQEAKSKTGRPRGGTRLTSCFIQVPSTSIPVH